METTLQMVFSLGYAAYDKMHRLPDHIRKAAHCIMVCRTAVLGGHTQACPDGHFKRHWYNSCKHRMCPLCAFTQIERWLFKQKDKGVASTLLTELNVVVKNEDLTLMALQDLRKWLCKKS